MQHFQYLVPTIGDITSGTVGQPQQHAAPGSNAIPYFDGNDMLQCGIRVLENNACEKFLPFSGAQLMTKRPPDTLASVGKTLHDFMTLTEPTSYSLSKASFACRHMRTSLEALYRLMTNLNSRTGDNERLCRFT